MRSLNRIMDEETRIVLPDGKTLTRMEAEEVAARIVEALDAMGSYLNLETPHPKTRRRVRGSRTVSPEFMASMIAAVEAIPTLRKVKRFDPDEARTVIQSRDALRIISERMTMLLAKVNYTIEARWADLASGALATFTIAERLSRDPDGADLVPHVEVLRRHLGRTNKKGKAKTKKKP